MRPAEVALAVSKFSEKRNSLDDFRKRMHDVLTVALRGRVEILEISSRVKTLNSFRDKISRRDKNYADPLNDLTDLVGLRIIAYYFDDLSKIEGVLRENFTIDDLNSRKASDSLGVQQFGYLSNHFIVSVDQARSQMVEWRTHEGQRAEIQVRTAAQHAWATLDHRMFYKATTEIPPSIARRMAILSALFELADEQFLGLRQERERLEAEYRTNLRSTQPGVTPLDTSAMDALLAVSNLPTIMDQYLTERFGFSAHTPSSIEPLSRAIDGHRDANVAEDRLLAMHTLQELGYEDADSVKTDFLESSEQLREALGVLDDALMPVALGSTTFFDVLTHVLLLLSGGDPSIVSDYREYQEGIKRAQEELSTRRTSTRTTDNGDAT